MKRSHHMPFGAQCEAGRGVRFRLWAPGAQHVELLLGAENTRALSLGRRNDGWFELLTNEAGPGTFYQYQIDGGIKVPDPASRRQPDDVHGPSQVVDPQSFHWHDEQWTGRPWHEASIYELHVGTFSPAGTFAGVQERLDYLADLGVTAIELMPVSDFPGRRNWGYDEVLPFAPDGSYGSPDDLKRLVQAAHQKGLMVFLDVVYNHFGPDGNYLRAYAPDFFTTRHCTPWGDGINFDGVQSRPVRDYFIQNALYWLEEYHFDGLRFDAVHAIQDDSEPNILEELAQAVRSTFGRQRHIHLILENYRNASSYLTRDPRGHASCFDAQWNDDIHHSLHVLITGETDGYYADYAQHPLQQLGRCLAEGFAFQGDYSAYHRERRGECSCNLPPTAFVSFLQNHDQIGNRAFGGRILQLATPDAVRAAMAILLLAPSPPLLFMGEEFAARTPFLFFCDFHGDLGRAVTEGRRNEFASFAAFGASDMREKIPDPNAEQTFARSKLDWSDAANAGRPWLEFYRNLLRLRQQTIVPHIRDARGGRNKFCVVADRGLEVEWVCGQDTEGAKLRLLANLGKQHLSAELPSGRLLFATHDVQWDNIEAGTPSHGARTLPPWFVGWFIES